MIGLEDSLSGSASSDSEDDDDSSVPDAVGGLLAKAAKNSSRPQTPSQVVQIPRSPLIWFHSPPSTQIGVYRSIFPLTAEATSYLDCLKAMQDGGEHGRRWLMLMVAGGHFAGVIVRVSHPKQSEPENPKAKQRPKPIVEILHHKTFHRYTSEFRSTCSGGSQRSHQPVGSAEEGNQHTTQANSPKVLVQCFDDTASKRCKR